MHNRYHFIKEFGQLLADLSPEEEKSNFSTEQELLLISSSLSQKDTEKQSILDLYRKQLITSKDVEDQLTKITLERSALEDRQKELKNALLTTNNDDNRKKDCLMLLGKITYDTKRNIIKQLVREVVACTTHSDNRDAPEVKVHIKFVFPQIVPCTNKGSYNYLGEITLRREIDQDIEMIIGATPAERFRWSRMQKGWLIKTLATKVGISPSNLSDIERNAIGMTKMRILRKIAVELEQPIWFLGCFENMPEDTFFDRLQKARCYHGHTKAEMAAEIGVNQRTIFDWKIKSLVK